MSAARESESPDGQARAGGEPSRPSCVSFFRAALQQRHATHLKGEARVMLHGQAHGGVRTDDLQHTAPHVRHMWNDLHLLSCGRWMEL